MTARSGMWVFLSPIWAPDGPPQPTARFWQNPAVGNVGLSEPQLDANWIHSCGSSLPWGGGGACYGPQCPVHPWFISQPGYPSPRGTRTPMPPSTPGLSTPTLMPQCSLPLNWRNQTPMPQTTPGLRHPNTNALVNPQPGAPGPQCLKPPWTETPRPDPTNASIQRIPQNTNDRACCTTNVAKPIENTISRMTL